MAHRDMSETTRISYLRSEIVVSNTVYASATELLAAQIVAGHVSNENEAQMINKCVVMALELAVQTDKIMSKPTHGGGID